MINPSILANRIRVTVDVDLEGPAAIGTVDRMLVFLTRQLSIMDIALQSENPGQGGVFSYSTSSNRNLSDLGQNPAPLVALFSLGISFGNLLSFTSEVVSLSEASDRPAEMPRQRFLDAIRSGVML
jgi:hypothetical protein